MAGGSLAFHALPGVPEIVPGADLGGVTSDALARVGLALTPGDVLVYAQKIVSKAEGRCVSLRDVQPSARAHEIAAQCLKDARLVELVLADPEGNELCVIEPDNSFVADRGRLGSITCDGTREVGCFWSAALGWPLVWDQDEETAIRAPDGNRPFITWGPPVSPKSGKNRLHLDIAAAGEGGQQAEVDRLVSLRASRIDIGQGDVDWVVMADPDGNEFCVLRP